MTEASVMVSVIELRNAVDSKITVSEDPTDANWRPFFAMPVSKDGRIELFPGERVVAYRVVGYGCVLTCVQVGARLVPIRASNAVLARLGNARVQVKFVLES